MTREFKLLLVKEVLAGLAGGAIGALTFTFLDKWRDLYASIMYMSIAGYLSMWVGIGVVGYLTLRKIHRQQDFATSIVLSFLGLIAGVLTYVALMSVTFNLLPSLLSSVIMPVVFPLAGAILGFNYKWWKSASKGHEKS